jgi:NAD(P)-dependent dehydrogenase (short-subunit alcohol dehydrogenase family)
MVGDFVTATNRHRGLSSSGVQESRASSAFAERGAKLALCDLNDAGGQETLRLAEAKGAEGLYLHADVAVEDEVERFVAATVARFGRLDVAVNNVARRPRARPSTRRAAPSTR